MLPLDLESSVLGTTTEIYLLMFYRRTNRLTIGCHFVIRSSFFLNDIKKTKTE